MSNAWLFDRQWTKDFTKVRKDFLADLLDSIRREIPLATALDVGCGVGDFSRLLRDKNLDVVGLDGRAENAAEAGRRHPDIQFAVANAEDLTATEARAFDLVLCFGLLYHLENPFRAIRELHALTSGILIIEGMYIPDSKPTMNLFDESIANDQGLNYVAFYPSEPCLIKMLYRSGFSHVYRPKKLPAHNLFVGSIFRKPVRTVLIGSKTAVAVPNLSRVPEPIFVTPDTSSVWSSAEWNPWSTGFSRIGYWIKSSLMALRILASRITRWSRKSAGR